MAQVFVLQKVRGERRRWNRAVHKIAWGATKVAVWGHSQYTGTTATNCTRHNQSFIVGMERGLGVKTEWVYWGE